MTYSYLLPPTPTHSYLPPTCSYSYLLLPTYGLLMATPRGLPTGETLGRRAAETPWQTRGGLLMGTPRGLPARELGYC